MKLIKQWKLNQKKSLQSKYFFIYGDVFCSEIDKIRPTFILSADRRNLLWRTQLIQKDKRSQLMLR